MEYFRGTTHSLRGTQTLCFVIEGEPVPTGDRHFLFMKIWVVDPGTELRRSPDPIYLDNLFRCIHNALRRRQNEPGGAYFESSELEEAVRNRDGSLNAPLQGFAAAVLMAIGFVECINPNPPSGTAHRFRLRQGMAVAGEAGDEPPA